MIRFLAAFFFILSLSLFSPLYCLANSNTYRYQVIAVLDGDTLIASDGNVKFRVRIVAMDAPEKGQPYAEAAKVRLQQLVLGKNIEIQPVGKGYDLYARVLGHVLVDGINVAGSLVAEGLAHYYRPTCKDYPADRKKYNYDPTLYLKAEEEAKTQSKGLWSQSKVTLPCRFRHSESGKNKSEEKIWKLWDFVTPEVTF